MAELVNSSEMESATNIPNAFTMVIGGDTVPTESNFAQFEAGEAGELVGEELFQIIQAVDYRVFNLEVPLTDAAAPISKCGPNLIAPTATVEGLAALAPGGIFGLANNHVLDQGAQGLRSTVAALEHRGLACFGAGENLAEAAKPHIVERGGIKVGLYACAEHEFTIAGEASPGANPFDPLESPDHVAALKEECDFIIVLYHGGKEFYRYPSPQLRKTCRKLAEKGADLIVCQHSHCVGCEERWAGSTIVYGQGNFLFDRGDDEFWQTGLLLRVQASERGMSVEYLPLRKQGAGVRLAVGNDADEILAGFKQRSAQICEPGFVECEYGKFADKMLGGYLLRFVPRVMAFPYRVLNRLTGRRLQKKLANAKSALPQINVIECEAHHELLLEGLRRQIR